MQGPLEHAGAWSSAGWPYSVAVDLMGAHLWQGLSLGCQVEVLGHAVLVHRAPKRCLLPRCSPQIQARKSGVAVGKHSACTTEAHIWSHAGKAAARHGSLQDQAGMQWSGCLEGWHLDMHRHAQGRQAGHAAASRSIQSGDRIASMPTQLPECRSTFCCEEFARRPC